MELQAIYIGVCSLAKVCSVIVNSYISIALLLGFFILYTLLWILLLAMWREQLDDKYLIHLTVVSRILCHQFKCASLDLCIYDKKQVTLHVYSHIMVVNYFFFSHVRFMLLSFLSKTLSIVWHLALPIYFHTMYLISNSPVCLWLSIRT